MIVILILMSILYCFLPLHIWFFINLIVIKDMLRTRGIYKPRYLTIIAILPVGMFIAFGLIIYVPFYYVWRGNIMVVNKSKSIKELNDKYNKLLFRCLYLPIGLYIVSMIIFVCYIIYYKNVNGV